VKNDGNLTLTYASPGCTLAWSSDEETGEVESSTTRRSTDCGIPLKPQVVDGRWHGARATASARPCTESLDYSPDGTVGAATFWEYLPRDEASMSPLNDGPYRISVPFTETGSKAWARAGAPRSPVSSAIQDARGDDALVAELPQLHRARFRLLRGEIGGHGNRELPAR